MIAACTVVLLTIVALTVRSERASSQLGHVGSASQSVLVQNEQVTDVDRLEQRHSIVASSDPDQVRTQATPETASAPSAHLSAVGLSGAPSTGDQPTPVARLAVTFSVDRLSRDPMEVRVLVAGVDNDEHATLSIDAKGSRATHLLRPGEYIAAAGVDGTGLGAIEVFVVGSEAVQVNLTVPYTFDLEFTVLDADSAEPISLARFDLARVDIDEGWHQLAIPAASSDATGLVRLNGMTPGRWRLLGTADGYGESETTFDYPGSQAAKAQEGGIVTLGAVHLPAIREFQFQLVNHEQWDDLTEFSVAHTKSGTPVPFSVDGEASLRLGWYTDPLYIKIDYPGRRASIRYLDGGLPAPGDVHTIDVGGPQELEIDLRISPQVLDALKGMSPFVALSYRAVNQDATKTGIDIEGSGTYVLAGIRAKQVVVSLETTESLLPVDWKSVRVQMDPDGRTSCTLTVDAMPVQIHVIDEHGESVSDFHCEIRQIPDDTTWASGGLSDEHGLLDVGRVSRSPCTVFGVVERDSLFAIDVAIDLTQPTQTIEFPIVPNAPTFVEVRSSAGPAEDVTVEFFGSTVDYLFHADWTDAEGRTKEIRLVTRSRAKVRLQLETRWTPTPEFDLQPGRNAVTVYDTGQLRVTSAARLGDIRSLDFDATLAGWVAADRITVETTEGGALLCRVPVGSYEVTLGAAEPRRVDVRVDAIALSGI